MLSLTTVEEIEGVTADASPHTKLAVMVPGMSYCRSAAARGSVVDQELTTSGAPRAVLLLAKEDVLSVVKAWASSVRLSMSTYGSVCTCTPPKSAPMAGLYHGVMR